MRQHQQHDCEQALGAWWLAALERGECPTHVELQNRFGAVPTTPPRAGAHIRQHTLADYDTLLGAGEPHLEVA